MKAVVAAYNQEKALGGAFSVITNLRMQLFEALVQGVPGDLCRGVGGGLAQHLGQHRDVLLSSDLLQQQEQPGSPGSGCLPVSNWRV